MLVPLLDSSTARHLSDVSCFGDRGKGLRQATKSEQSRVPTALSRIYELSLHTTTHGTGGMRTRRRCAAMLEIFRYRNCHETTVHQRSNLAGCAFNREVLATVHSQKTSLSKCPLSGCTSGFNGRDV